MKEFDDLIKAAEAVCLKLEGERTSVTYLDQDKLRAAVDAAKKVQASGPKKSLAELNNDLRPYKDAIGRVIRHVKTDALYVVTSVHFRESDMKISFEYGPKMGDWYQAVRFTRPIEQMFDGRFKA